MGGWLRGFPSVTSYLATMDQKELWITTRKKTFTYICEPQKRNLIKINWDRRIHIGQILKQLLLLLL